MPVAPLLLPQLPSKKLFGVFFSLEWLNLGPQNKRRCSSATPLFQHSRSSSGWRMHSDSSIQNFGANAIGFETPEIKTACLLLPKFYDEFLEGLDAEHPKARFIGAVTKISLTLTSARLSPNAELPLSITR